MLTQRSSESFVNGRINSYSNVNARVTICFIRENLQYSCGARAYTHTRTRTHAHTHTHARTRTHTHTLKHARTHAHNHTVIHTNWRCFRCGTFFLVRTKRVQLRSADTRSIPSRFASRFPGRFSIRISDSVSRSSGRFPGRFPGGVPSTVPTPTGRFGSQSLKGQARSRRIVLFVLFLHVLSSSVLLKSVLLISCVFWDQDVFYFKEACQQTIQFLWVSNTFTCIKSGHRPTP